jgi:cholest-4-en-3-one 26-monooxygenase
VSTAVSLARSTRAAAGPPARAAYGRGPHFCLGANLARAELRAIFHEILTRMPDMEPTGEPQRLRSNFINGIKHLPVRFTPSSATAKLRALALPEGV